MSGQHGHDLIEHRIRRLTNRVSVIEHDVLNDPQTRMVQPLDHLTVLAHAIVRVERIAAFRREKVHRVVAPVEPIAALNRGHRGLLLRAIGRKAAQVWRSLPGALVFVNAGEMKARQQMDSLEAGVAERFEMLHTVSVVVGEGQVSSAMSGRHG